MKNKVQPLGLEKPLFAVVTFLAHIAKLMSPVHIPKDDVSPIKDSQSLDLNPTF